MNRKLIIWRRIVYKAELIQVIGMFQTLEHGKRDDCTIGLVCIKLFWNFHKLSLRCIYAEMHTSGSLANLFIAYSLCSAPRVDHVCDAVSTAVKL